MTVRRHGSIDTINNGLAYVSEDCKGNGLVLIQDIRFNTTLANLKALAKVLSEEGIIYTSRLSSATPAAGNGFELDAIASPYIGGTAVTDSVGMANAIYRYICYHGSYQRHEPHDGCISYQYIIKSLIFIIIVAFDVRTRNK